MLQIKRVYESPAKSDGVRILVDRLWPRGLTKEKAAVDLWLKEVAPSTELRKWFHHEPEKFKEFSKKYTRELIDNSATLLLKRALDEHKIVTLVYGAKDPQINHAAVLRKFLM